MVLKILLPLLQVQSTPALPAKGCLKAYSGGLSAPGIAPCSSAAAPLLQVRGMSAPAGPPPAHMTCSHAPPQPALEPRPPPVEPPSETAVKKKLQIREVHVSAALMDEFLQ